MSSPRHAAPSLALSFSNCDHTLDLEFVEQSNAMAEKRGIQLHLIVTIECCNIGDPIVKSLNCRSSNVKQGCNNFPRLCYVNCVSVLGSTKNIKRIEAKFKSKYV